MSNFDELEEQIGRLPLKAPAPAFDQRMRTLFGKPEPVSRRMEPNLRMWMALLATAACAAIAFSVVRLAGRSGLLIARQQPTREQPQPLAVVAGKLPQSRSGAWLDAATSRAMQEGAVPGILVRRTASRLIDGAAVFDSPMGPLRRYRQETFRAVTWIDPDTDKQVELIVPENRIIFISQVVH